MDFTSCIFHHALTRPEKPAIILADRVVTYAMMARGILSVAARLEALAVPPGNLVAVAIASPIWHLIVVSALFRLGYPTLSTMRTRGIPAIGLPVALYLEDDRAALVPGLKQVLVEADWFTGAAASLEAPGVSGFPRGESLCRVALSSGTTGQPKAFSSTVAAIDRKIHCYYVSVGQGHWDRMLSLISLTSGWGFTTAAHALYAGKTLCFAPTARDTLVLIALYSVDCLVGSTQHLGELVAEQGRDPLSLEALRTVFVGGSLPSRTLLTEARASLCSNITVQYGSSEAASVAFAPADKLMAMEGAVGYVAPWAAVEAVDEDGNLLPPDRDGILRVKTDQLAQPYPEGWANDSFRDGWFYPGDRGRVMPDGMLIVSGRISEVVPAKGGALAPEAIDDIVRSHAAVADAAAVASAGGGKTEVWVAIVPRAPVDPEEIVALCASKGISVDRVVAVKAIPRNVLGKIQREKLNRELRAES
jgi:acyl-coenzyme A synthetase/AMP-(fatty) acid ligase